MPDDVAGREALIHLGAVTRVDVFSGEIRGVGSMLGVRVVIGRWPVSPFGPVADAMVEDAARVSGVDRSGRAARRLRQLDLLL
jgi:hypothetical protein